MLLMMIGEQSADITNADQLNMLSKIHNEPTNIMLTLELMDTKQEAKIVQPSCKMNLIPCNGKKNCIPFSDYERQKFKSFFDKRNQQAFH